MSGEHSSARRVGTWAASVTALFAIAYIIAQLLEWAGVLGSAGGPNSSSTPAGLAIILTPSLLLGPAFLITMVALDRIAPAPKRIFSELAVAFATIYAALNCSIYFVQLTFVAPRIAQGNTADIQLLLFVPYKSFLFAADLLGYSFMSASTLFAAFGLPATPTTPLAKAALIANGLLVPSLALQMYYPSLIWVGSLWAITFPVSAILLARLFATLQQP